MLIALTKACVVNSKARVRVDGITTEPFDIVCGLQQDDGLSPLLFNVTLQSVVRGFNEIKSEVE